MNLLSELNTFENIAYCSYRTDTKEAVNNKTKELIDMLEFTDSETKYPSEMSGGQQRVAIGCALIGGELELGRYTPENKRAREERVFTFINEHNW